MREPEGVGKDFKSPDIKHEVEEGVRQHSPLKNSSPQQVNTHTNQNVFYLESLKG